jgi:hypothetical protein
MSPERFVKGESERTGVISVSNSIPGVDDILFQFWYCAFQGAASFGLL